MHLLRAYTTRTLWSGYTLGIYILGFALWGSRVLVLGTDFGNCHALVGGLSLETYAFGVHSLRGYTLGV